MKVDTKAAREFSEGGDSYTGAEVRLWVHNLADEVDRLRAALAKKPPMTDDQIRLGVEALGGDLWNVVGAYFREGVRFAERHHGIDA